ncbi:hypothetical protein PCH_Pc16g12020 [Penicillium rubens Wisconsin 54-1255]|uniref:Uncharacterized protein n=1 Tax=Penicillium rubens (strain ATCC 28089 / DSM 1075 / NRRL 1951 / Wisconsin 54-1255) TaxID=500485 RepID=B6H9U2_PENRW|nr:hypothetical protein PCH_Pc16g12020 [Penicillium rubens Wisconsin 54-1255]
MQQDPSSQVGKANPRFDPCSSAPTPGRGKRKTREGSESSSPGDPIESLVDPEVMAKAGPLVGPGAARELDKRQREQSGNQEEEKGSLNIKIHLDLHAKFHNEVKSLPQNRTISLLTDTRNLQHKQADESIISNSSACCHCQVSEGNADVSSIITVPAVTRQVLR